MKFDPALPADGINVSPTHPLREFALLVVGLLGCVVLLVALAAFTIDRLVPLIPPQFEAELFSFSAVEEDEREEDGEEDDPRVARIQGLLDRIVSHWPENPYRFQVGILEESEPNAVAFPGGYVFVTTGLLESVESENELALVLGHEVGHYRGRHHLRGLGRGLALALVMGVFGASSSSATSGVANLAADLTQRGFGRDQEREADAFGLSLVQAEYGHVDGALDFFRRLPDADGAIERHMASYLSTHPLSEERIEDLRRLAEARGWPLEGSHVAIDLSP